MTAPIKVKLPYNAASFVEISGRLYVQKKLTIEERNQGACIGCCARLNLQLCEYLAPHCWQGWVFEVME